MDRPKALRAGWQSFAARRALVMLGVDKPKPKL
jgi:hypothetical protein